MVENAEYFPLNTTDTPTAVVGSVGQDFFLTAEPELDFVPLGGKKPYTSFDEIAQIITDKKLKYQPNMIFPGNSTGNFAVAENRLLAPEDGPVVVFTTLTPYGAGSDMIRDSFSQGVRPIILRETPFLPTDEEPTPANPFALIQQTGTDRRILSFKSEHAPAIEFPIYEGDTQPGVLVMGAASGHWQHTVANAVEYAQSFDTPVPGVIFASESQLRQLEDEHKRLAFIGGADTVGAMNIAAAFIGNVDEARLVIEAANKKPLTKAGDLGKQLKEIGGPQMKIASLTQGSDGATLVDQFNNVHTLEVTDLSSPLTRGRRERKRKAQRLGEGDAFGATVVYGIRALGTEPDKVRWTLYKAAENAARVMRHPDAQRGLMDHERFYRKAMRGLHYSMTGAKSSELPPPPRRTNGANGTNGGVRA